MWMRAFGYPYYIQVVSAPPGSRRCDCWLREFSGQKYCDPEDDC